MEKAFLASVWRDLNGGNQLRFIVDDAHALAAAARDGFDDHGIADLARESWADDGSSIDTGPSEPGTMGTPALRIVSRAAALSPIRSIAFFGRTDEMDVAGLADVGEIGVLRQEIRSPDGSRPRRRFPRRK